MAKNETSRPYLQLGHHLENWRRKKFSSASLMMREKKFSFSYSLYSEFERGTSLPEASQIVELAHVLEQDAKEAILLWAKVQMPTEELKSLFSAPLLLERRAPRVEKAPLPKKETALDLENTWVFSKEELSFLKKEPWFFEFCICLALSYPSGLKFSDLGLKGQEVALLEKRYLAAWIRKGRISLSKTQISLNAPYIYLPKTKEWDEIRDQNLRTAVQNMSCSFREVLTAPMSAAQAAEWEKKMQLLTNEFHLATKDNVQIPTGENAHTMVCMFGPRSFSFSKELKKRLLILQSR